METRGLHAGWRTHCAASAKWRAGRTLTAQSFSRTYTLWSLFPCRFADSLRGKREVAGRENPDGTVTISRAAFDLLRLKDHAFDTVKEVGCGMRLRQLHPGPALLHALRWRPDDCCLPTLCAPAG